MHARMIVVGAMTAALLVTGCGPKKATYDDPNKVGVVSTEQMGTTDVKMAAEEMKNKLANYQFPDEDRAIYKDGRVRVRVIQVDNQTSEHFNVTILTEKITQVMQDCGKIVPVAEKRNLKALQQERNYQDVQAKEGTKAKDAQAVGPRYALVGTITKISMRDDDTKQADITFTLALVNIETEENLCQCQREIRKTQER